MLPSELLKQINKENILCETIICFKLFISTEKYNGALNVVTMLSHLQVRNEVAKTLSIHEFLLDYTK